MTEAAEGPGSGLDQARVARVLAAARRFVIYRERATAIASGRGPGAISLGEAIDRDFLLFDMSRAERELREAVIALDPEAAPVWLAEPAARAKHAGPG